MSPLSHKCIYSFVLLRQISLDILSHLVVKYYSLYTQHIVSLTLLTEVDGGLGILSETEVWGMLGTSWSSRPLSFHHGRQKAIGEDKTCNDISCSELEQVSEGVRRGRASTTPPDLKWVIYVGTFLVPRNRKQWMKRGRFNLFSLFFRDLLNYIHPWKLDTWFQWILVGQTLIKSTNKQNKIYFIKYNV